MRDKPDQCYDAGCPLAVTCRCGHALEAHVGELACSHTDKSGTACKCVEFRSIGRGFVLGCGDPRTAKYMAVLEAPGKDEIQFEVQKNAFRSFLATQEEVDRELSIRRRDYPGVPEQFLKRGVPVVGQTGAALQSWIWPKAGMNRDQYFIDNTLRCLPFTKGGKPKYPTAQVKKGAERACRMWDRVDKFRPDALVFTLHPAGVLREVTPLPLVIKDFERVRDFAAAGRKVLVLLGGKSTGAFARYGTNVTKWRGHYQIVSARWSETYKQLFEFKAKMKKSVLKKEQKKREDMDAIFDLAPGITKAKFKRKKKSERA